MGTRGPVSKKAYENKRAKGVGPPPAYISKDASGHYTTLAELLIDRLEPEDEHILAQCAQAMAEIALSNHKIQTEGMVTENSQGECVSPWMRARDLAHKGFHVASSRLGLSPADRYRLIGSLAVPEPSGGPSDFDKEHGSESA